MRTTPERKACLRAHLAATPFAIALALASPPLMAGANSYHCDIVSHTALAADGTLGKPFASSAGERLAIDRTTGRVLGPSATWVSFAQEGGKSTVLSRGSSENGFVATHFAPAGRGGAWHMHVYVYEFAKSETKPFVITFNDEVVTGICR